MSQFPIPEIMATGSIFAKAASVVINAPAAKIFSVLAAPQKHLEFDGSGHLRGHVTGPERLALGARFGMSMKWGAKYRTVNTVKEFEEDRLIAWSHFFKHRWRYQLRVIDEGTTEVIETFDARSALIPPVLFLINAYAVNQRAVLTSLALLKQLVEE
jgi:uncharacterized protein YndB with AHSA1/START domain